MKKRGVVANPLLGVKEGHLYLSAEWDFSQAKSLRTLEMTEPLPIGESAMPKNIRRYLLYWDKIDYPYSNAFPLLKAAEADGYELLKSEGIVIESNIFVRDDGVIEYNEDSIKIDDYFESYEEFETSDEFLEKEAIRSLLAQSGSLEFNSRRFSDMRWSIGSSGPGLIYPEDQSETAKIAEVELENMLPVPSEDVPIEDILDYKLKRKDDLDRLWRTLDELYLEVANNADPGRAKNMVTGKLKSAIVDVQKTLKEEEIDYSLSSVATKIKNEALKNISSSVLQGLSLGLALGEPAIGTTIGTGVGTLQTASVEYKSESSPDFELGGMDYLYNAASEGVIEV